MSAVATSTPLCEHVGTKNSQIPLPGRESEEEYAGEKPHHCPLVQGGQRGRGASAMASTPPTKARSSSPTCSAPRSPTGSADRGRSDGAAAALTASSHRRSRVVLPTHLRVEGSLLCPRCGTTRSQLGDVEGFRLVSVELRHDPARGVTELVLPTCSRRAPHQHCRQCRCRVQLDRARSSIQAVHRLNLTDPVGNAIAEARSVSLS